MRPVIRDLVANMYLRGINVSIIVSHLVNSGLNKAATPETVVAIVEKFQ